MNENAKKWVEALRSGDYKQTKGALSEVDAGYCCLGVACQVALDNGVDLEVRNTLVQFEYGDPPRKVYEFDGRTALLPPKVRKWLGLRTDLGGMESRAALVNMNDQGVPFNEIADIIESEPRGLFVLD